MRNYRRGFFRLWIVISGIYIGVCIAFGYGALEGTPYNTPIVYFFEDGASTPSSTSLYSVQAAALRELKNRGQRLEYGIKDMDHVTVYLPADMQVAAFRGYMAKIVEVEKSTRTERVSEYKRRIVLHTVLAGVLPPIVLLAFGAVVAWIARGFVRA